MNLFDPLRPKLGSGRPCLLGCASWVPSFDTTPIDANTIELEVMLNPGDGRGYVWYKAQVQITDLSLIFARYISDPEKLLTELFNWDPTKIIAKRKEANLSPDNSSPFIKTQPRKSPQRDTGIAQEVDLDILD